MASPWPHLSVSSSRAGTLTISKSLHAAGAGPGSDRCRLWSGSSSVVLFPSPARSNSGAESSSVGPWSPVEILLKKSMLLRPRRHCRAPLPQLNGSSHRPPAHQCGDHDRGVSKYLRTFSQVNFIISVINLSMSSFFSSVCIVNACEVRMALIFCGCGILKPLISIPEFGKACDLSLLELLRPFLGDQQKLLLLI